MFLPILCAILARRVQIVCKSVTWHRMLSSNPLAKHSLPLLYHLDSQYYINSNFGTSSVSGLMLDNTAAIHCIQAQQLEHPLAWYSVPA